MRKTCVLLFVLASASPAWAQSAAQLEANKQVVREFYKYWPADVERAAALFTDDHIEHAPRFVKYCAEHNLRGKTCFLETMRSGAFGAGRGRAGGQAGTPPAGRGPAPARTPDLVTAEGDLVTFIFKRSVPDPETPGRMYDAWSFDTYRIRDGKIAEHWDSATLNPPPAAPPVR
jgi:predicted SnoaL-like aldol condensation-catalyzing enzyme